MAGEVIEFTRSIVDIYQSFSAALPNWLQTFVNLFLLVIVVAIYAIFIWKFYRFIAKKNLIELNLNQYNRMQKAFATKLVAGCFYFLEYIVILPFVIFFWFAVFTLFLIFLTEGLDTSALLVISAVIVGAIRMSAYYKQDLAKDIAKLFPLTLLAISMTKAGFFDFERILGKLTEIPTFLGDILGYLLFIIVLEIILRTFEIIFSIFEIGDADLEEENEDKEK